MMGRRATRGKAFAAALVAFLLTAQLLAVAHFHRSYKDSNFSQAGTAAVADACGLCDLALHAPVTPAAPFVIQHPLHQRVSLELADSEFPTAGNDAFFLSRAPPCAFA
jgi:hypothetical protein